VIEPSDERCAPVLMRVTICLQIKIVLTLMALLRVVIEKGYNTVKTILMRFYHKAHHITPTGYHPPQAK
jgi:hypothetical protein